MASQNLKNAPFRSLQKVVQISSSMRLSGICWSS